METSVLSFAILLFIIAGLYASVGHGGASGYLALMGLFHFAPDEMRSTALLLNVVVSLVAAYQYSRTESVNRKLFLWLIAGSIPAAYFGTLITIESSLYKQILGVLLIFQALRLSGVLRTKVAAEQQPTIIPALVFGILIGLLSGIIGIGGGIILSPLLLMLGWCSMRQTAYISALFILANSLAGIAGLYTKGFIYDQGLYIWVVIAFAGGLTGAWLGRAFFSVTLLKRILAVVLMIAGIKLIAM